MKKRAVLRRGHVYLKPGELFISAEPTVVTTVLGSCIAVTMFHRKTRFGGICHGMLPECRQHECPGSCSEGFKYVDCAIQFMYDTFKSKLIPAAEIEVKLFGGADMFQVRSAVSKGNQTVGTQNLMAAMKMLENKKLKVAKLDIGGNEGRKLFFTTDTGEVLLKRLRQSSREDVE
ncbi:MAG: chemotaxis protein CheD [Thermodesulfovibrionales bacterium]